jgi:hypothetical protein
MSMAAQLAQNAATMDGAIDGMESWEVIGMRLRRGCSKSER